MTNPLFSASTLDRGNYPFHHVKCKSTGIGCKKDPKAPKKHYIKWVSAKQAHRTAKLHRQLKQMMIEMELHGEFPHCQLCGRRKLEGDNNGAPLYAEHVWTRNRKDADKYENLGVACYSCNTRKGSKRPKEDYRPAWFVARMKELDRSE